jgi:L-iditol 2-dehydrogenase
MKAILASATGGFELTEVEVPTIGPGEVLLEMRACGLCGTDLAKLANPAHATGLRLGHELAGVVREVGAGVRRFAPGDRMLVAHHVPCGTCWACRHEHESMCPQFKATNLDPCGFAELIRVPAIHVEQVAFALPAAMSFEVASFAEPLACAVRALQRSQVQPGDRIAVVGGGGMGLLIAQALAARAAQPLVLDIAEARLDLARRLGLSAALNPARQDVGQAVAALTDGVGLDGVILTVLTQATLDQARRMLRPGGGINVFASPSNGRSLSLDFDELYHRELAVFSTYSSTPAALAEAFALLVGGRVAVEPLISHRLALAAFAQGVELQRRGASTKVIFHP